MTKDGKKTGIMVGAAALIAGIIYAMSKKPKEGEGAGVAIEILDANGNPVPKKSPASLVEGTDYTIRVTVTNGSTRGGVASHAYQGTIVAPHREAVAAPDAPHHRDPLHRRPRATRVRGADRGHR